jgi:cell pole-organizing protein PopZ
VRVEPEPRPVLEQPSALDQPSDILDLTESMAAMPPPPPPPSVTPPPAQFRTIDGASDVSFAEAGERGPMPGEEQVRLISNATSAAVDSAFNTLAQTVLMQNSRTLEDLVREMLRPMLKSWLDDNLPGMVERLVRAEIERVSRGRMS